MSLNINDHGPTGGISKNNDFTNIGVDTFHETYQESAGKRISFCFYLIVGLSYCTYLIYDNFTDVSLFSSYYNALPNIVTASLNYY